MYADETLICSIQLSVHLRVDTRYLVDYLSVISNVNILDAKPEYWEQPIFFFCFYPKVSKVEKKSWLFSMIFSWLVSKIIDVRN